MKHILWLLAILIFALPVAAQDEPISLDNKLVGAVDVTGLTINRAEDNSLSLTIFGNPVSCDAPVVEQSRHELMTYDESGEAQVGSILINVQITTRPPRDGEVCNFFAPFSHTVALEGTFETDENYVLKVNNFTAWIFLVRPGQQVMDMGMQQVDVGETELMGWIHNDLSVDNVEYNVVDNQYVWVVDAIVPDGCTGNVMSYITQDTLNPDVYHVEVFRLLSIAATCMMGETPIQITLPLNLPPNAEVTYEIDGQYYENIKINESYLLTYVTPRLLTIDSVTISGSEGAYRVEITGTKSGDCGMLLYEISGNRGAVSVIDIYDQLPEGVACTRNLIPYENAFTVFQMPVVVNGVMYFNDESEINIPQGGNFMQVDTVIEDVSAEVLESFPMQVVITVTGYQPDGCKFPVQVDQTREEDTVTLNIYRQLPDNVRCPMNIVPYEESIQLEGGFTGDSVTVIINGETYTFDL